MTNEEIYKIISERVQNNLKGYVTIKNSKRFDYMWWSLFPTVIMCDGEELLAIYLDKKSEITMRVTSKDPVIAWIVKAIVWHNRNHKTIVKTEIEKTYEPGKDIEYYIEGANK